MFFHFSICLIFISLVGAQNPCRVNVVFGIDASVYLDAEGQAIVFNELTNVKNIYRSWTISPSSVRVALPRAMGCSQGGNWTLQNDLNSTENVANTINRFVYTCFLQFKISDEIEAINREILQYQKVDQGVNYVFVILTATTDTDDVQLAISLRQKYFDPHGYGLVIVRVQEPIASNLNRLQTYGLFDLSDQTLIKEITTSVCAGGPPPTNQQPTTRTLPGGGTTIEQPTLSLGPTPSLAPEGPSTVVNELPTNAEGLTTSY